MSLEKNELMNEGCEDLWVSINAPGIKRKIIIGLIYRHPNSDPQVFIEALNKRISNLNLKKSEWEI